MLLRDAFSNWKSGEGIFELFTSTPWGDAMDSISLNIDYFGNHSGSKFVSPLLNQLLVDGELTSDAKAILAKIIEKKFRTNWERLWLTNSVNYTPENNYDYTETRTSQSDTTESQSITDEASQKSSSTETKDLTDETTHGKTQDSTTARYVFNSESEEPVDHSTSTEGGTTTEKNSGTNSVETSGSDSNERNVTGSGTETETETIKRSGNIGVTTNQQLITEERELWLWSYFEQIYSDVDKVLTIPFYDQCQVS